MASIREFKNKDGTLSFQIRVYKGKGPDGKQLRPFTTTFTPEPSWSVKTARKKAHDFAALYEQECKSGMSTNNKVTFQEYAEYVLQMKVANGTLKHTTEQRYRSMTKRLYPVMGYMKIKDIKPQFLNSLYMDLLNSPIQKDDKAIAKPKLKKAAEKSKLSFDELSRRAGCSHDTLKRATDGYSVSYEKAEAICKVLDAKVDSLFVVEKTTRKLSPKTVCEYHRFISSVLTQAVKEMIVPFNMAERATPPRLKKKEANYYEPDVIREIEDAFDQESSMHRMLGYLMIFTGARRGELLGLEWHNVNFEKNTVRVEKNVLYTPDIGVYVDTPKTETSKRYIALPQMIMDMLAEYKLQYDEIKTELFWDNENDFIFVRENGEPINPTTISSWLRRVEEKYALPHLNAHAFRHSMATALIYHGIDPVSVSKRLGHNQVSTTTNIYSHAMSAAESHNAEVLLDIYA